MGASPHAAGGGARARPVLGEIDRNAEKPDATAAAAAAAPPPRKPPSRAGARHAVDDQQPPPAERHDYEQGGEVLELCPFDLAQFGVADGDHAAAEADRRGTPTPRHGFAAQYDHPHAYAEYGGDPHPNDCPAM